MVSNQPTTQELADARGDIVADALPDTCTIQRAITVPDGGGGFITAFADHQAGVPCRLAPPEETSTTASAMREVGGQLLDEMTRVITLPAGTAVLIGDRLLIDAQTFEATLVGGGGAWELARHIEVRQLSPTTA
jgi:hypothetical protein